MAATTTPAALDPGERITFPDLVRHHFCWHQAVRDPARDVDEVAQLRRMYHLALARFEHEHGALISAYWCAEVESAVALTAGKPDPGWLRRLLSVAPRFHRVSDWATRDEPDIARALHQCDEIAVRASEVLRGRSRRICIQLVMTSACHLLSLVDARSQHTPQSRKEAVAAEIRELGEVRQSYREASNGDAQLVYFAGMALGIAALGLTYLALSNLLTAQDINRATVVGTLVAGGVGAVVSVIARVNSGSFALDSDVPRGYTLFLGSLRPWIGSVFGLLIYLAVESKFVQLFDVPKTFPENLYSLCVLAFAAGFSERWAQDTLTGGLTGRGRAKQQQPATAKAKGGGGAAGRPPPERAPAPPDA